MTKVLVMLVGVSLSGCAVQPMMASAPAPYQQGMSQGCSSGENAAGNPWQRFTKDPQRYAEDGMYKQGWDDGFMRCKGQYEAVGRALR